MTCGLNRFRWLRGVGGFAGSGPGNVFREAMIRSSGGLLGGTAERSPGHSRADLNEFVSCDQLANRHERRATWSGACAVWPGKRLSRSNRWIGARWHFGPSVSILRSLKTKLTPGCASIARRERSSLDQSLAEGDAKWEIDLQDGDSRAANGGQSTQNRAVPSKMAAPFVAPRIEESHNRSGYQAHQGFIH